MASHLNVTLFLSRFAGSSFSFGIASATRAERSLILETDELRVVIDELGRVISLADRGRGTEYAVAGQDSPLLQVRVEGRFRSPEGMRWVEPARQVTLDYGTCRATITTELKGTHLVLELAAIDPPEAVDRV
jgi:hypothetical protein